MLNVLAVQINGVWFFILVMAGILGPYILAKFILAGIKKGKKGTP